MKRIYQKPEMKEILQDATVQLLSGSRRTPPEEIPDYDDWLGAPPRNGDADWDDEEDDEEDW